MTDYAVSVSVSGKSRMTKRDYDGDEQGNPSDFLIGCGQRDDALVAVMTMKCFESMTVSETENRNEIEIESANALRKWIYHVLSLGDGISATRHEQVI
ncbi:hypothetical protein CFO_g180 [Ceratocystis platani]|uniref:Uncharacterized protein n=1 Tax=Ceratocystis fimbriata f. sp. platani TaxID=88771 RepID=A0A0F8BY28_CERFI|nr:hypothetical protein CFO_g180 [Ceratocystis platani]